MFDIGNIQALAVYNLVFTAPYLRAPAGGARRSNYTKWQTKVAPKQFGAKQSKVAPEAPNKEKWRLWRLWRQIKEEPFLREIIHPAKKRPIEHRDARQWCLRLLELARKR